MPRKIILLNGHPGETSLSSALTDAYQQAAEARDHEVRRHDIRAMAFDADFGQSGFRGAKPLEPALERFMADVEWSDHLVLAAPLWWGGLPARLKGLFDRALLPGTAFDPRRMSMGFPEPLLKGRTARVMITADTPGWAMRVLYRRAVQVQLGRQILGFVGFGPVRFSHFAPVEHANENRVRKWIGEAGRLGREGR